MMFSQWFKGMPILGQCEDSPLLQVVFLAQQRTDRAPDDDDGEMGSKNRMTSGDVCKNAGRVIRYKTPICVIKSVSTLHAAPFSCACFT
jgi:hypothetical protein